MNFHQQRLLRYLTDQLHERRSDIAEILEDIQAEAITEKQIDEQLEPRTSEFRIQCPRCRQHHVVQYDTLTTLLESRTGGETYFAFANQTLGNIS